MRVLLDIVVAIGLGAEDDRESVRQAVLVHATKQLPLRDRAAGILTLIPSLLLFSPPVMFRIYGCWLSVWMHFFFKSNARLQYWTSYQ